MSHLDHRDIVIVGASLSGGTCAIAAREAGYDGSIALLGQEWHVPYSRPGLTKAVLRGEKPFESTHLKEADWYEDNEVDLVLGCTVSRIDPIERRVVTSIGELSFDTLVLATGATPRLPSMPGGATRVSVVRVIEDSRALQPHLVPGARLLIIGGGYIGVEVAASALQLGCEVELVMQEEILWSHMYGDLVGGYFERRLREHGARIHAGRSIVHLADEGEGVRAKLDDGEEIVADWVVAGIGVIPNLGLATAVGLDTDSGVLVDECLRSSAPGVYAVGDIAQYESVLHGRRLRIEHWDHARSQGRYVGERIAGLTDEPYSVTPYFFSQLSDWMYMRYVGPGMGEVLIRGDMDADSFAAAYVKDGRLVACLTVDRDDDLDAARRLLGAHVDITRLRDSEIPLADAVSTPAPH